MPPPSPSGLKELHESDSFFAPFPHADWSTFLSVRRLEHFSFRPPIEVLNRGNSAFITVFVVETDDGTASSLIGAPNTFHARTTHNLIGRCAAERAFLALRLDVCFHLLLPPYNTPCNNP